MKSSSFFIFSEATTEFIVPLPASHNHLTDQELLEVYRQSADNRWLGYLLQRHTLLLLGVAMKYLKDRDAAEDAVQHLFMKAVTHLPTGHIHNLKGWLYMVLRNYCLQQLRDTIHLAPAEQLEGMAADPQQKEELELKNYTLEQLHEALPELNKEQHSCIRLFYLEEKSYQDITNATGYTFGEVKSHIQNGKRNLKIALLKKINSKSS